MTFSDKRVVDLIKENFVAVWESVAPVKTATFDLGDGRSIKGTVGGEIAIYFCRPDGGVYDILPALQSPAVTYTAIESALEFYRKTGANLGATRRLHMERVGWNEPGAAAFDLSDIGSQRLPDWSQSPHKKSLEYRLAVGDPGTRALSEMSLSKVGMVTPAESITVVEPGGGELYGPPIHYALSVASELVLPESWKNFVFETVLGQKLEGGDYHFNSTSLTPFSISQ